MVSNADSLALPQTLLTGLSLFAVIVAVAALAIERIRRVREHDKAHETTKASLVGCFSNEPVSAVGSLLGRHAPALTLPSVGGLIEVADRGLWTSATLDHMLEIHPELTWVPLYEGVFDELVGGEVPEEWREGGVMGRIFGRLEGVPHEEHRSGLAVRRRELFAKGLLKTAVRKLPGTTTTAAAPKNKNKGLSRVVATWLINKKPCIPVTREELVALSLAMGMTVSKTDSATDHYSGIGAHGLSLDLAHTDANWQLSLVKGSRIPRHAPSMGSGYTALMAKHLACGSVPFAEKGDWVRSVYVTDEVLAAVKSGRGVVDTRAFGGSSLEFLRRMPAEKGVDAYYGLAEASASEQHGYGPILDTRGEEVGRWARLVAGIAFGGLVPQAHANVIRAVRFTVAGKLDGCVQNLESLVDALHGEAVAEEMFGERVAARTAATGHVYVNYDYPASDKNARDAAAGFARYMNLLERVVARCEAPESDAVGLKTTRMGDGGGDAENGMALQDLSNSAASQATQTAQDESQPSDAVFEATCALLERVYSTAVKATKIDAEQNKWWSIPPEQRTTLTLSKEERDLVGQDLGGALAQVTEVVADGGEMTLEHAAVVVRCVLAAWADTVPRIDVLERVPRDGSRGGGVGAICMDALPPVMALD